MPVFERRILAQENPGSSTFKKINNDESQQRPNKHHQNHGQNEEPSGPVERCEFCKKIGHDQKVCRKKLALKNSDSNRDAQHDGTKHDVEKAKRITFPDQGKQKDSLGA